MKAPEDRSLARPLRAALVALFAVAGFWSVYLVLVGGAACDSGSGEGLGCVGLGLVPVVLGAPLVIVLIAWGLRGKGALHSWAGAVLSAILGLKLTHVLVSGAGGSSELAGLLLSAVVTAAIVALWAELVPRSHGGNRDE